MTVGPPATTQLYLPTNSGIPSGTCLTLLEPRDSCLHSELFIPYAAFRKVSGHSSSFDLSTFPFTHVVVPRHSSSADCRAAYPPKGRNFGLGLSRNVENVFRHEWAWGFAFGRHCSTLSTTTTTTTPSDSSGPNRLIQILTSGKSKDGDLEGEDDSTYAFYASKRRRASSKLLSMLSTCYSLTTSKATDVRHFGGLIFGVLVYGSSSLAISLYTSSQLQVLPDTTTFSTIKMYHLLKKYARRKRLRELRPGFSYGHLPRPSYYRQKTVQNMPHQGCNIERA
ncbi:hypothetical protein CCUS01_07131 [Colletotrichum cuscutae]|uniref:Uncharacterized protein n=1 Tax=Colletotrichum cuscutae TaxID=1209917 RepID=A0AAI9XYB9_9PEZI|nr:hypothetical protein CCUS01_07131 [Colletotrichum cuscutae]